MLLKGISNHSLEDLKTLLDQYVRVLYIGHVSDGTIHVEYCKRHKVSVRPLQDEIRRTKTPGGSPSQRASPLMRGDARRVFKTALEHDCNHLAGPQYKDNKPWLASRKPIKKNKRRQSMVLNRMDTTSRFAPIILHAVQNELPDRADTRSDATPPLYGYTGRHLMHVGQDLFKFCVPKLQPRDQVQETPKRASVSTQARWHVPMKLSFSPRPPGSLKRSM